VGARVCVSVVFVFVGVQAVIYAAAQASKKFAGMLSDDLLEGTRANARGARGGEQGGIEASSADMLYLLLTCITGC
jgi:hypothetical protein